MSLPFQAPPWNLKGEGWWIFLSLVGRMKEWMDRAENEDGHIARGLGPAHFDKLEQYSRTVANDPLIGFRGGLGLVQIYRYRKSPIGPYDELLIVPGSFGLPETLTSQASALRITRIYVSTLVSVLNGRHHWNIPKHLARFEFSEDKILNQKIVKVYGLKTFAFEPNHSSVGWTFEPQFFETPFFCTIIQQRLPGVVVPYNLINTLAPNLWLCQPPLESAQPGSSEQKVKCALVGTKKWKRFLPHIDGQVGLCSFHGGLDKRWGRFGDGKKFPDFEAYRIGFHISKVDMNFPEAQVIE
ncbi:hypothetical protein O181_015026 [Austropuccinia psidii MF-1]|uniref:Uncharacterized protein n=1 Tax=Austropuccinia psidii MF-1 TaxID=1389203 RepID=A0A9Q3C2W5_9BASI|nr:hypothetical protein [Austropuccinia psidii MF-1]